MLHGEAYSLLIEIDIGDNNLYLITYFKYISGSFDTIPADFADVDKAFDTGDNGCESTECGKTYDFSRKLSADGIISFKNFPRRILNLLEPERNLFILPQPDRLH